MKVLLIWHILIYTKTCEMLPLDLMSLDDMGLLCKNGSMFSICPLCPIILRPNCVFKKRAAHVTLVTPSPVMVSPHFNAQRAFQALNDKIYQIEDHFECILGRIATHFTYLVEKVIDMQATIRSTHQQR